MSKRDGMRLPLGRSMVFIQGGPYRDRPVEVAGVKMAVEIDLPCDVDIPTRDFNVPEHRHLTWGLAKAMWLLRTKGHIYVGCMGGVGRTGLFMAVLTRVLQGKTGTEAVEEVRRQYRPHAVETQEQNDYVSDFPVAGLQALRRILAIGT